jgi:hypothetical protein
MTDQHRRFNIYGGSDPVLETLLGRITKWCSTGTIDYIRPVGSMIELTRFRMPGMTFNDRPLLSGSAWRLPGSPSIRAIVNL